MEELRVLLDYTVVPLLLWIWYTDKKLTIVETKLEDFEDFQARYDKDMIRLFDKIDDLKDEFHSLEKRKKPHTN